MNSSTHQDEDGDFSDWFEVHNADSTTPSSVRSRVPAGERCSPAGVTMMAG